MTNAYKAWNNVWLSETKHDWKDADPFVTRAVPIFNQKKYKKILDVGCGIGRHSLLFEQCGFKTTALDGSQAALDYVKTQNKNIKTIKANYVNLPLKDNEFDAVLAFQTIHHGDALSIMQAVKEIYRVLKPKGTFFGTVLSKKHEEFGKGKVVDVNTYIRDKGLDPGHPHTYANAEDLVNLLVDFDINYMKDAEIKPKRHHWFFCAEAIK